MVGAGAIVVAPTRVGAGSDRRASVGPFAYLRPGTVLAARSKVGTFVETKNSEIGDGAKVPHLSYVGDATIGEGTNIGAATVFVNYDGVNKHRTVIGAHARTGADNMFVAPVDVGDGAYTAAGSVITKDVPPGALGVARAQQRNVDGWVRAQAAGHSAPPRRPRSAAARHGGDGAASVDPPAGGRRGGRTADAGNDGAEPTRLGSWRRRMGSIVAENRKTLMLFSGRAFPELADEIGAVLGIEPTPTDAYDFANGEIFVRYQESVRGSTRSWCSR